MIMLCLQTQFWFPLMLQMLRLPTSATKQQKVIDFVVKQTSNTPTITKDEAASCSIIRETIWSRKIPEQIAEIIGVMETYYKVKIWSNP